MSVLKEEASGADHNLDRRRRLQCKEQIQDRTTIGILRRIGVGEGWHCLEVGAGAGSIAAWLLQEVGASGQVLATDLDTSLLGELECAGLRVLQHDVVTNRLDRAAHDLVHVRDLLYQLPQREAVLGRLADAVKPGGWLLVEEPDASSDSPDPLAQEEVRQLYARVMDAIYIHLRHRDLDPFFGATLVGHLRRLGFGSLHAEARCCIFHAGQTALLSPNRMAFPEVKEHVIADGLVSAAEFEAFLGLFDDPGFSWREGLTVSAWGRR